MIKIPVQEAWDFIRAIEAGSITLTPTMPDQHNRSGNIEYLASNGWTLAVFADAGEWDYIDNIQDKNRVMDFDDMPTEMCNYVPSEDVIEKAYHWV